MAQGQCPSELNLQVLIYTQTPIHPVLIWGKLRAPPPPTEGPLDSAFEMLEPEEPRMKERLEGCAFTAFGRRAARVGAGT